MATSGRPQDFALKYSRAEDDLRRDPCSFEFFQAVRLLELMGNGREPVGHFADPGRETVRLRVHNALAFPASQIQSIDWSGNDAPCMAVNFMGLTGPMGVLPYCYTEFVISRLRAKDSALQAFLDIFNHRIISFFYRAWEKYRFPVAYERGEDQDQFSHHLLDLMGLGTAGLQDRQNITDISLAYYCGLLSSLRRSAVALEQLLCDYFEIPAEVEQFAGAWNRLDTASQCRLDEQESLPQQLGIASIVGDEVWDQQSRVRLKLGPMGLSRYLDFLPGGRDFEQLRALTRFFSNDEFAFEAQLILKKEAVPQCELGAEGEAAPRLGWLTWAKTKAAESDRADTILEL
jgi:type VI secretion system protein ImpH